jgi:hypothetical protein
MLGHDVRIRQLTSRVRWLDTNRRVLAIALASLLVPLMISEVQDALGADWPQMHMTLVGAMLGVVTWWVIEVGLVWLTAIWETDCDRLVRSGGLPLARLVVRK